MSWSAYIIYVNLYLYAYFQMSLNATTNKRGSRRAGPNKRKHERNLRKIRVCSKLCFFLLYFDSLSCKNDPARWRFMFSDMQNDKRKFSWFREVVSWGGRGKKPTGLIWASRHGYTVVDFFFFFYTGRKHSAISDIVH